MQFSTSFVDEPCKRRFSRHIFLFDQGNSWIQNSLSVIGSRLPIVFIVDAEEAPFFPPYLSTFTCVSVGIVGCQESNWCKLEWHI